MKKILLLVLIVLFIGCQQEDEKRFSEKDKIAETDSSLKFESDSTIIPIDSTNAQKLLYKLNLKETIKYVLENVIENTTTVEFEDSTYKRYEAAKIVNHLNLELIDINKDGSYDIDITITDFYLDLFENGVMTKFSSDSTLSLEEQKNLAFNVAALRRPFRISINRYGKLYLIGKSEEILTKYLELSNTGAIVSAVDRKPYRDELHGRILSPIIRQLFRQLPNDSIVTRNIWSEGISSKFKDYDIDNIIGYAVEGTLDDNQNILKVAIRMDSRARKNLTAKKDTLEKVIEEPKQVGAGYFKFDIEKGLITEAETISRRTMKIESIVNRNNRVQKNLVSTETLTKNRLDLFK